MGYIFQKVCKQSGAGVAKVRGAQKIETLASGLTHAKTLRLLGAVVGSSAFAGCLMAGKDAYGHVGSGVELCYDTFLVLLLWPCCCLIYDGVTFFGAAISAYEASYAMASDTEEVDT